jgi:hypothetical protein
MNDLASKEGREKCWSARDAYWTCLDENQNEKNLCKSSRDFFEKNCSKTWVINIADLEAIGSKFFFL